MIVGHVLLGTLDENIVRYVIYSFHMPLFMFISGYMINITKLSMGKYKNLFSKYWDRMLKMWCIAYIVFSLYQLRPFPTTEGIISVIYSPWYHLWYVPTLFCYIIIVRFLFKATNKTIAYSTLIFLSVIWTVIWAIAKTRFVHLPMTRWCDLTFMPYFALGLFFKNHINGFVCNKSYWIVPILYFPAILVTKFIDIQTYGIITFILLCIVVIFFLYPSIKNDSLPKSSTLSYIGSNSLAFYLWHMIFVQPMKDYVSNTLWYYFVTFSILSITIVLIKFRSYANRVKIHSE